MSRRNFDAPQVRRTVDGAALARGLELIRQQRISREVTDQAVIEFGSVLKIADMTDDQIERFIEIRKIVARKWQGRDHRGNKQQEITL